MAIKIYTKTGDAGNTSLLGGTKISKSDLRIESYGSVDELNAFIGSLADGLKNQSIISFLRNIQSTLFTIGSHLACDAEKFPLEKLPSIDESFILELEQKIDAMNAALPEMKHFILPGGHPSISAAHICRCVCRRAERCCVRLLHQGVVVEPVIIKYLNRLSDYFFMLARYIGKELKIDDVQWIPGKEKK